MSLLIDAAAIEAAPMQIPGATPGGIEVRLLNIDPSLGVIATIVHIKPGAEIPAHYHELGSEAHYVLKGELIDAGRKLLPGTYLTHAAGVVHGPHRSETGCEILTLQGGHVNGENADFHLADPMPRAEAEKKPDSVPSVPPDMALEPIPLDEVPLTQRLAPTPDNPTNPSTG